MWIYSAMSAYSLLPLEMQFSQDIKMELVSVYVSTSLPAEDISGSGCTLRLVWRERKDEVNSQERKDAQRKWSLSPYVNSSVSHLFALFLQCWVGWLVGWLFVFLSAAVDSTVRVVLRETAAVRDGFMIESRSSMQFNANFNFTLL